MKIKIVLTIVLFILAGAIISGCAGGAGIYNSWPGMTVDDARGLVYLAHGVNIYAVNLSNGTEKWRYPEQPNNKVAFYVPPALTKDNQLIVGSYDHSIYSINPDNGQQIQGEWPFTEATDLYVAGALTKDSWVYVPNNDYNLYGLDTDGKLLWTFTADQSLWSTPVSDGKALYLASMDHSVYAIDPESGKQLWQSAKLSGSISGTPTLGDDGKLYFGTYGDEMVAMDTSNGEVLWQTPVSSWVWGGPALNDGKLYFGDMEGNLYALDAATGAIKWNKEKAAQGSIVGAPLVIDQTLYFTAKDGTLYSADTATGTPGWHQLIGGALYGSPVQAGDKILVAPLNTENLLYAFDKNGNQAWSPYKPEKK